MKFLFIAMMKEWMGDDFVKWLIWLAISLLIIASIIQVFVWSFEGVT